MGLIQLSGQVEYKLSSNVIVETWNEYKFLFSFYFCLFFFNGIIKIGKSKKKIEICIHSKFRL